MKAKCLWEPLSESLMHLGTLAGVRGTPPPPPPPNRAQRSAESRLSVLVLWRFGYAKSDAP